MPLTMKKSQSLLIFLFILLLILAPSLETDPVIIHLSNFTKRTSTLNASQAFSSVTSDSFTKYRFHKRQKSSSFTLKLPLFPQRYGVYLVPLSFGTPPQTLFFTLDTGSSLTWFPCGAQYLCHNSSRSNEKSMKIETFNPTASSSLTYVGCNHPKSQLFLDKKSQTKCGSCNDTSSSQACLKPVTYDIKYSKASTSGVLTSETLQIYKYIMRDFIVGCSFSSVHQPDGVVGFGRGFESLPSQMGIKKFAYCLSSIRFEEYKLRNSYLVLSDVTRLKGLSYTAFHKSSSTTIAKSYYYMVLEDIIVGHKKIQVPRKFLIPGAEGYGGTIVDSGTSFTFMERSIYKAVIGEFTEQLGKETHFLTPDSMRSCFNVSHMRKEDLPTLALAFKGGATMKFPFSNYFIAGNEKGILCLPFTLEKYGKIPRGPTIILGNIHQINFYIEYDLENERFGFRTRRCL